MEYTLAQTNHTHFDVACSWIMAHESEWVGWLQPNTFSNSTLPIILLAVAVSLALIWATLPVALAPDHFRWYKVASLLRPTTLARWFGTLLSHPAELLHRLQGADCIQCPKWLKLKCCTRISNARSGKISIRQTANILSRDKVKGNKDQSDGRSKLIAISRSRTHIELEATNFKCKVYSARQHASATFLQSYARTRSLNRALDARSQVWRTRVRDGMQFSQRIVYGVAGNAFFEVCLVRGETQRCEARALTLSVIEETAHLGVDFELANYEVHFLRGECFAKILVPLLDSGLALQGDMARSWRPVRDARLLLHLPQSTDDVTAGVMGDVTECNIKIVNSNKWPGEHLKQQNDLSLVSIFKAYVLHVLYENLETDCWWFVGVLVRAFNTSITTNVLSLMLVDLAILGRSLDW
jgi:hypothetical protein